tara:strand:+ start:869 stop:1045 length:177 start_codon:yes stop_codon:yes gene_type:complete
MFKTDFLEYAIERKRKEEDLIKSRNNQIQLEVPEYYVYEEKEKKKENIEPKRVIIIEL